MAWIVSLGRWRSWSRLGLKYLVGSRVLELGYGPGHLQAELLAAGWQVFGLDESPQMGRLANSNFVKWNKYINQGKCNGYAHNLSLVRGLAQALPFPNASIDSVLATFPTRYIFEPLALREIRRVLRPGGRLVIVLGAWITGGNLPDRLTAWLFKITGQVPEWKPKTVQPFQEAGFEVDHEILETQGSQVLILIARVKSEINISKF